MREEEKELELKVMRVITRDDRDEIVITKSYESYN